MMSPARSPLLRLALVALIPCAALAVAAVNMLSPEITPAPPDDAPPALDRLAIVIDSSASMKGYFTGKTTFKDVLADLITVLPRSFDQDLAATPASTAAADAGGPSDAAARRGARMSYFFSQDDGLPLAPFEGTAAELHNMLLDDRVPYARSTFLQNMLMQLRQVLKKEPGAVGILITDGLMSFPNERIRQNPEITRQNFNVLVSSVQDALAPEGWTPGLQLSVLQYVSPFNGVYYTYRNEAITLAGRDRPFYLWLLGEAERVDAVVRVLRRHRDRDLRPAHEVTLPQRAKPNPRVLLFSDREGTWHRDRTDRLALVSVKADRGREVKFQIALDLPDLPGDVAGLEHLTEHLRVEPHLVNATLQVRTNPAKHHKDERDFNGATHFLEVRVSDLQADEGRVRIVLPDVLPGWCGALSSDDDHDVNDEERPRTFGLSALLDGAATAFQLDRRPVFQFVVTLRR